MQGHPILSILRFGGLFGNLTRHTFVQKISKPKRAIVLCPIGTLEICVGKPLAYLFTSNQAKKKKSMGVSGGEQKNPNQQSDGNTITPTVQIVAK